MTTITMPTEPRDVALMLLRASLSDAFLALAAVADHAAGKRDDATPAAELIDHAARIRVAARDVRTILPSEDPGRRFAATAGRFADLLHDAARGRLRVHAIEVTNERLRELSDAAAAFTTTEEV